MANVLEESFETVKTWLTRPLARHPRARRYLSAFAAQAALVPPQPGVVILDVGANEGQAAARYRRLYPAGAITSFEPHAPTAAALRERFAGDDLHETVELAACASGGTRQFYANHETQTNSLLRRPATGRRYYRKNSRPKLPTTVTATTLDAFARQRGVPRVDILKLDVEGAELAALRGAEELLREQRIGLIYAEVGFVNRWVGDPLFWEVCAFLDGFQYSLYGLFHVRRDENGQTRTADALFVCPAFRETVDSWD
jgi:FkbM family methyltransferase